MTPYRSQKAALPALLLAAAAAPAASGQPVLKVLVAEARRRPLPATSVLVGTAQANRTSVLGSEVAGRVRELPVREGDRLDRGQLVCQLDDDRLRLEQEAAAGRLESLQATLSIAKARLQRWTFERERIAGLDREHQSNEKEVYDTEAEYLVAVHSVREAEHNIAEQKARVQLAEVDLHNARITAPFAGYVTALKTEVGQWLERGGPVIEMIDLDTVLVRVDVPEQAIRFLHSGDPARVQVDALEGSFSGRIRRIIPQADRLARTFPVDVEIANADHVLRSGLFCRVAVRTGPAADAPAVLKDAVVFRQGGFWIWTIQDAGPRGTLAVPLPVTLGAEDGEWVAITSGNVTAGMPVVVRGNERLMPFPAPVEIVEEEALRSTAEPAAPAGPPEPPAGR